MEQAQGVIEEIATRLRAIHGTLERIEHLLILAKESHHDGAPGRRAEGEPGHTRSETGAGDSSKRQLLTVGEVAARLGQSVATIREWGYLRQIEIVRLGRSVRISTAEVDRLIKAHRQPPRTT
jgi:excisionase family DNA binding protein